MYTKRIFPTGVVSHAEIVKFDEWPTNGPMLPITGFWSPKYVKR